MKEGRKREEPALNPCVVSFLTSHLVSKVDESDCLQPQQVQRAVDIQRSHLRGGITHY